MKQFKAKSSIILALDFDNDIEALTLLQKIDPHLCRVKIGKELFTQYGPGLVEKVQILGFDVFLDLKFHDIPNTVAGAIKAVSSLGVWMTTLHVSGGLRMIEAARDAVESCVSAQKPLLIGVTVLTSLADQDLAEVGFANDVNALVLSMAKLAVKGGLDGVVCSAIDLPLLTPTFNDKLCFVTPGIKLVDTAVDDQVRVMRPEKAIKLGSDYLVIGRAITKSRNPIETLTTLYSSIA